MSNNLWKNGTKKAFYGYVASLLIALISSLISLVAGPAMFLSGGLYVFTLLMSILALAATVYYFLGIKDMKEASAGTETGSGANLLFIGAIITICGSIVAFIPVLALIAPFITLAGFIVAWVGYSNFKSKGANANVRDAGGKLSTSALISVIAGICAWIPVIGWIVGPLLEIVAFYFAFTGWKTLAESELE